MMEQQYGDHTVSDEYCPIFWMQYSEEPWMHSMRAVTTAHVCKLKNNHDGDHICDCHQRAINHSHRGN